MKLSKNIKSMQTLKSLSLDFSGYLSNAEGNELVKLGPSLKFLKMLKNLSIALDQ